MEPGGGRASVHGPARRLLAAVGVLGAVAMTTGCASSPVGPTSSSISVNNVRLGLVDAMGGEPSVVPIDGAAADLRPST